MSRDTRFLETRNREQASLYGQSLREAVAGEAEVLALEAALAQLDFGKLEAGYPETGHPSYPPRVLAGILLYGYSLGLRSSRQLEGMCRLHAGFRYLAFGLEPDHNTLCRFRRGHGEALRELFRESVRLCQEAGLVRLGRVAVDGTKLRANRSRQGLARAEAEFAQALAEAEAADGGEEGAGQECALMKTTEGIQPAYNAQAVVDAEAQVIVACAVSPAVNDSNHLEPMLAQVVENCGVRPGQVLADGGYLNQEQVAALEGAGQEVYVPVRAAGLGRMRWEEGSQAYRCPEGKLLRACGLRKGKLVYRCFQCRGCPQKAACKVTGVSKELHVAPERQQELEWLAVRMGRAEGQAIYRQRSPLIEPVFGWRKHNGGFRRFLLRGQRGAEGEWCVLCALHNLWRWVRRAGPGEGGTTPARSGTAGLLLDWWRALLGSLGPTRWAWRERKAAAPRLSH
jgi:transposase